MAWIVLGEDNGKVKLVSKTLDTKEKPGILPKGSYLTIEDERSGSKFILRVDDSSQYEPYKPSPLVIDMGLSGLYGDAKCQNIITAYRVKNISDRTDGKIDFIHPQSIARRSKQEEVDLALGGQNEGPKVFIATIHGGENQLLIDEQRHRITTKLPIEMFYHQMQITGKTGSGKTVAMKYLAQYFVEKLNGAVLAINVKDIDFLQMDQPSETSNEKVIREWENLGEEPHGIENTVIYYPANTNIFDFRKINHNIAEKITLNIKEMEPESLTGLLQNITDIGAQNFPDIFRYWQQEVKGENYKEFVNYFSAANDNPYFKTLNSRGDKSEIQIHRGTYNNIMRNLNYALEFFDNPDAKTLDYDDILSYGKMSVINVAGDKGIQFGSILLRHLLKRIVKAKSEQKSNVPVLIIIDEVHQFYNTESSREALGVLDTICRTGRSQEIGVVFSSQNPNDLPKGLSSVVNSKIIFRSDGISGSYFNVSSNEIQSIDTGFALVNIHNIPQLKIIKFPLSFAGVK